MIDQKTINRAAEALNRAAPPGSKVILFGSYARGDAAEHSDLDFLVVEPNVTARIEEAARLDAAARDVRVPMDVVVLSRDTFDYWRDTPNTLPYRVFREGKVLDAGT
jgi:predicted nucleotidyltransferase